MEITSSATITTTAYFDGSTLKTHNTEIGNWYGDKICEQLDITRKIEEAGLMKGEYEVIITLKLRS